MRKFFLLLWKAESRKSEKKWCCSWWLLGWFFFAVIRLCPHSQFYLSFQFYVDTESVLFFLFVWVLFLFSVHKCVLYRDLVFFSSALYSKYTLNVIWVGWKRIKEERREKNERICFGNFNVIRFVVDTLYHCQRLHSIENKRNTMYLQRNSHSLARNEKKIVNVQNESTKNGKKMKKIEWTMHDMQIVLKEFTSCYIFLLALYYFLFFRFFRFGFFRFLFHKKNNKLREKMSQKTHTTQKCLDVCQSTRKWQKKCSLMDLFFSIWK